MKKVLIVEEAVSDYPSLLQLAFSYDNPDQVIASELATSLDEVLNAMEKKDHIGVVLLSSRVQGKDTTPLIQQLRDLGYDQWIVGFSFLFAREMEEAGCDHVITYKHDVLKTVSALRQLLLKSRSQ